MLMKKMTNILAILFTMSLFFFSFSGSACAEPEPPFSMRSNESRTAVAIPIDAASAPALKDIIEQMQRNDSLRGVNTIISMIGANPELIISGNSSYEVERALETFRLLLATATKQKHLVVISACAKSIRKMLRMSALIRCQVQ